MRTKTVAASGSAAITTSTAAHGAGTANSRTAPSASAGIATSFTRVAPRIVASRVRPARSAGRAARSRMPRASRPPGAAMSPTRRTVVVTGPGSATWNVATTTPSTIATTTGLPSTRRASVSARVPRVGCPSARSWSTSVATTRNSETASAVCSVETSDAASAAAGPSTAVVSGMPM
ncbi:MAG TPA: hypothetical protein VGH76_12210 [Actinomycetospora sp.]